MFIMFNGATHHHRTEAGQDLGESSGANLMHENLNDSEAYQLEGHATLLVALDFNIKEDPGAGLGTV